MGLGPRLELRQSQQLVMTPQLQQAIKLLTLTNLELEAQIEIEVEKNPLLDIAGPEDAPEAAPEPDDGDSYDTPEPESADRLLQTGDAETDAPLDVDYAAETFHHDSVADGPGGLDGGLTMNGTASGGQMPEGEGFEATLTADLSLIDVLLEQAGRVLSGLDLVIAQHLIDMVDEAGYLEGDTEDVAERLGVDHDHVLAVLKVLQGFEPSGVAARTLGECLAIQAREADRYDPAMARMLANLHLVARGDFASLRRICGVDQEDVADMIAEIRAYNPKPGLAYGGGRSQTVVPDVFVARLASGGWGVELNNATLPKVLVNKGYYAELRARSASRETKAYLSDCLAGANWLVKALDQRQRTILKVATEIVRQQEGFFERGVRFLKPLNLRAIADVIGMHESTVSRVTSNKYMSCERGTFELKYFFSSGVGSTDSDDGASNLAVKSRIKALIDAETAETILSDDKLMEVLQGEGFDLARRTVAKYREALGLGSSVQRRRAMLIRGAKAA
jgi:RNA polymerase sigma-54 factor